VGFPLKKRRPARRAEQEENMDQIAAARLRSFPMNGIVRLAGGQARGQRAALAPSPTRRSR